eukprot:TRINITY_DN6218_c0_g2_i2.p1 TRINITY_DN6218_c0_g2~~TRINITY_DN6218_c0_g2_i2.p1  ORF type:complete len:628 (-),score=136.46 TRINITY_DN6218_c0_g2_i2:62-1945(-)
MDTEFLIGMKKIAPKISIMREETGNPLEKTRRLRESARGEMATEQASTQRKTRLKLEPSNSQQNSLSGLCLSTCAPSRAEPQQLQHHSLRPQPAQVEHEEPGLACRTHPSQTLYYVCVKDECHELLCPLCLPAHQKTKHVGEYELISDKVHEMSERVQEMTGIAENVERLREKKTRADVERTISMFQERCIDLIRIFCENARRAIARVLSEESIQAANQQHRRKLQTLQQILSESNDGLISSAQLSYAIHLARECEGVYLSNEHVSAIVRLADKSVYDELAEVIARTLGVKEVEREDLDREVQGMLMTKCSSPGEVEPGDDENRLSIPLMASGEFPPRLRMSQDVLIDSTNFLQTASSIKAPPSDFKLIRSIEDKRDAQNSVQEGQTAAKVAQRYGISVSEREIIELETGKAVSREVMRFYTRYLEEKHRKLIARQTRGGPTLKVVPLDFFEEFLGASAQRFSNAPFSATNSKSAAKYLQEDTNTSIGNWDRIIFPALLKGDHYVLIEARPKLKKFILFDSLYRLGERLSYNTANAMRLLREFFAHEYGEVGYVESVGNVPQQVLVNFGDSGIYVAKFLNLIVHQKEPSTQMFGVKENSAFRKRLANLLRAVGDRNVEKDISFDLEL